MRSRLDLVIVGMGSAGVVASEFAAGLGLRVAAVERDRVGGDCLWTGCVPSKALLASARVAQTVRTAADYGLPAPAPMDIDTAPVWDRLRQVQTEIAASDDNPERIGALGVEMVAGAARLTGPHTVDVGGRQLRTRFVLICTGSRPAVPPIAGLEEAGYLTSENVFELGRAPASVVVMGGGPVAVEMAQALRRLDVRVDVLQRSSRLLTRDEPELVAQLTEVFRREGIGVHTGVDVEKVTVDAGAKTVTGSDGGGATRSWSADEIMVAAGRRPNVEGLGLDDVGVEVTGEGIRIDSRGRTTVPSVYAAGDVTGERLFTHAAAFDAVQAVRDMFFPGKGQRARLVPWCTFTDPELAHVGQTIAEAEETKGAKRVDVFRSDLAASDRARADGSTTGRAVVVTAGGRIVGAHILAPAAGELIGEFTLAIHQGLRLDQLAGVVHVYPTLSTTTARLAADAAFAAAHRWAWVARLTGRAPRRLREWLHDRRA